MGNIKRRGKIIKALIRVIATITAAFGIISFIRLRPTLRLPFFPSLRSVTITAAPVSATVGMIVTIEALRNGIYDAAVFGVGGTLMALYKIRQVNPAYRLFVPLPPPPDIERNVDVGGVLCDIWYPPSPSSGLTVINLHGGAWFSGDKGFAGLEGLFRHLTSIGHTVVDVAYPLAPNASLTDQIDAIHRVVAAYQKGYQIVLMGASSGGHLALMAAYTHPDIHAVVAYSPPTDLEALITQHYTWDNAIAFIRNGGQAWLAGRTWAEASPLTYVTENCPPTLLLHGEADMIVPAKQSRRLYEGLQSASVVASLIIYAGAGHAFETPVRGPSGQAALHDVLIYLDNVARE